LNNSSVLGLKNLSDSDWEAILPNGATKVYNPGQVIRLGKGIKIKFSHQNVAEVK
jgi:hypothetical protein